MVTSKERKLAKDMNDERELLENKGVPIALSLGFQLQSKVLAAYKARRNPIKVIGSLFRKTKPLLRDGMVAAHLLGVNRKEKQVLSLSVYTSGISAALRRSKLSRKELDRLSIKYGVEVTGVLGDMERVAKESISKTLLIIKTRGLVLAEGVKLLQENFEKLGLTPANSATLESIFRTQMQISYSAGRWQSDQDPDVQEILWGYKYVTVGDTRVRPTHAALEGVTLPKDSTIWNEIFPPNGYNCRCLAIPIFDTRSVVKPKSSAVIGGMTVKPGADKGFAFNPGKVFS